MRVRFPLPAPFSLKTQQTLLFMKKTIFFGLISVLLALIPANAAVSCSKQAAATKEAIVADQSKLLEIVSSQVTASPNCACEIVKAAIEAAGMASEDKKVSVETVTAIAVAAATAAPAQIKIIGKCVVAMAPDALASVQAALSKLDPNMGDLSNPLDFPGGLDSSIPVMPSVPPFIVAPNELSKINIKKS
jgi:hypothetical protein